MKPYPVTFYLYADDESQVQDLQRTLYDFVNSCYNEKVYVSARRLSQLIKQASNNPILKQYLK